MPLLSRTLALIVLAALTVSSAGAQGLIFPAAQNSRPAGCHGHPQPTPAPLNHDCCIAGHDQAVPGNMFSGLTLLPFFGALIDYQSFTRPACMSGSSFVSVASPPGSPGLLVLRI